MAYISKERVKEIRTQLKKEFPELRLSVRTRHHSTVEITIKEGPYDFFNMHNEENWENKPKDYVQVNEYYIKDNWTGKAKDILLRIKDVAVKGSYNRNAADLYADYCDFTFYVSISIGEWDSYYKLTA